MNVAEHHATPPALAGRVARISKMLGRSVNGRWRKYQNRLKRCRKDSSETVVHAVRIALRRLTAALDVMRRFHSNTDLDLVRRRLKQQLDGLSTLRDVQIQIEYLQELASPVAAVQKFQALLIKREKKLVKKTQRNLAALPIGKLTQRLAKGMAEFRQQSQSDLFTHLAMKRLVKAIETTFGEVVDRKNRIAGNPEAIHRLRVAFKKFRYTIEALQPALGAFTQPQLEDMQKIQDRMGEIQDLHVLSSNLRAFASRKKTVQLALLPIQKKIERRLQGRIRIFLRSADQILTLWPPSDRPAGN